MPLIALLVEFLVGALISALPALIARLLLALGISFVAFQGLDALVNTLADKVRANLSDLPVAMLQILKIGGFTTALNILVGALAGWATLKMSSKVIQFMASK